MTTRGAECGPTGSTSHGRDFGSCECNNEGKNMASTPKNDDRHAALGPSDVPDLEKPSEPPSVTSAVSSILPTPINSAQVTRELPSSVRSSNGSKTSGKSSGGKGRSGKTLGRGGSSSAGTTSSSGTKKKVKKNPLKIRGILPDGGKNTVRKKNTSKRGVSKSASRKRYRGK